MGFAFLDRYDVDACAAICNAREPDGDGGVCQYFNIWRALVNGIPTTYTCALYYVSTDISTATNKGQGPLSVTCSRGYTRKNLVIDGGFEGYACDDGSDFCFTESTPAWTGDSSKGGVLDALIFDYVPFAHSGHSVATLGSGVGADDLAGTYTPAAPLRTKQGATYLLQFWHASNFNEDSSRAFLEVTWDGVEVATIRPGSSPWTRYSYIVVAKGNDIFSLHGGAYPAYDFIDDISLFFLH